MTLHLIQSLMLYSSSASSFFGTPTWIKCCPHTIQSLTCLINAVQNRHHSPTTIPRWIYRFSSDHRSQAASGPVSTWMGDRLGIPGVVGFCFFSLPFYKCPLDLIPFISYSSYSFFFFFSLTLWPFLFTFTTMSNSSLTLICIMLPYWTPLFPLPTH